MNTNRDILNQMTKIASEYGGQVFEATQIALQDAAKVLERELSAATPIGNSSNHFKDNWDIKTEYKNVRYVGNKKAVRRPDYVSKKTGIATQHEGGIPLATLFEHARHMRPFIYKTWELNKNKVFETFKNSLGGKI